MIPPYCFPLMFGLLKRDPCPRGFFQRSILTLEDVFRGCGAHILGRPWGTASPLCSGPEGAVVEENITQITPLLGEGCTGIMKRTILHS